MRHSYPPGQPGLARSSGALLHRLALWGVLAVSAFVLASPSYAAEPTEEDKKKAGEFYKEGSDLFKKELYSGAIQAFEKAHKLVPHPANLYNIARSHEKLGDAENCVKGYEAYVDFYKRQNNGQDPKDIIDVRASIAKCRLLQRPKISIGSEPPGAKVYIDDKERLLGQTPFETTLDPGKYKIMLDLDGHVPFEENIEVRAGEPVNLRFRLEKFQRVGTIRVKANVRGASIFLDGRNIGLTPYTDPITVDEGAHQISVKKDEYTDFNKEVKVEVNTQTELVAEVFLRDSPMTWKGYVGWVSLVAGAALVGVGGFFAGQEAEKYFNDTDDFDTYSGYQKLGYGIGGGLLGAGIGLLIWEATDSELVRSEDELDPVSDGPRVLPVFGAAPSPPGQTGAMRGVMVGADVRF